jgi:hypothetical protein
MFVSRYYLKQSKCVEELEDGMLEFDICSTNLSGRVNGTENKRNRTFIEKFYLSSLLSTPAMSFFLLLVENVNPTNPKKGFKD